MARFRYWGLGEISEEERDFQTVITEIEEIMAESNRQNHDDLMQLEVFSGMIASQGDVVFVQNNPSLNERAALSWFT
jgi:hypothetical protein